MTGPRGIAPDGPTAPGRRGEALAMGLLAVLWGAAAVAFALDGRFLHDEGLLTWQLGSILACDPAAGIFFLKVKPLSALANLPGVLAGHRAFLAWHAAFAAAALPLAWWAARREGIGHAWLVPLVLAGSPMLLGGAAAGVTNTEAVTLATLGLALVAGGRGGLAAGVLAALLPLARFEMALPSLLMAAAAWTSPGRRRFLAGGALAALAYAGAGMAWHGDPIWFVHYPPAWLSWGDAAAVRDTVRAAKPREAVEALAALTPVLPLAFAGVGGLGPRLLAVAAVAAAGIGLVVLFPVLGLFMGFAPRYLLFTLPFLALLAARRVEAGWGRATGVAMLALGAAGVVLSLGTRLGAGGLALSAALVLLGIGGLLPRARAALAAAASLASLALAVPTGLEADRASLAAARWVLDHPAEASGPVYTNVHALDARLASVEGRPADVRFLLQPDMEAELRGWTNAARGQTDRVLACLRDNLNGRMTTRDEFLAAPAGALVVLKRREERSLRALPPGFLEQRVEFIHEDEQLRVGRLRPAPARREDDRDATP